MAILANIDDGQNEQNRNIRQNTKTYKNQSFYNRNHTKSFSAHGQGKVFPLNQTWNKSIKRFEL